MERQTSGPDEHTWGMHPAAAFLRPASPGDWQVQALCLPSSPPAPALHLSHSCLSPQLLLDATSGMSSPRLLPPGVWLVAAVYLLPWASRHCGSFSLAGMHLQRTVSSKPVFAAPRYLGASPAWALLELAARTADVPALVVPAF